MRLNLLSFECVFRGTGNRVAHELARLGLFLCNQGEEIMSSVLPDGIGIMVANDLLANE